MGMDAQGMSATGLSAAEPVTRVAEPDAVAPYLAAASGDRVAGLLAYALAAEAGEAGSPGQPARRREEALRELEVWAFRRLHNQADELRREGAAEARAAMRAPPSFLSLVLASLTAIAIAGAAAAAWLAQRQGGLG
jgi:hypothetical protein